MPALAFQLPIDNLAAILRWLGHFVWARGGNGRFTAPVMGLIIGRIREANQRFARLAARLGSGSYRPRRYAVGRTAKARTPPRPSPLRLTFGWLVPLLPEAIGYRSQLEFLFNDPEMAALMAAAPASTARVFRPLCWMLGLKPPPVLARPRPARPAATAPPSNHPVRPAEPEPTVICPAAVGVALPVGPPPNPA